MKCLHIFAFRHPSEKHVLALDRVHHKVGLLVPCMLAQGSSLEAEIRA